LIESGADVNIKDKSRGWTALHWASESANGEIVRLLIESGADPYIPNKKGKKPIDYMWVQKIYEDYKRLKSQQRLAFAKINMNPENPRYTLPPEILELIATSERSGSSRERYEAEALPEVPAAGGAAESTGGSKRRTKKNKRRTKKNKKKSKKARSKKRS
jgi:hypothetical protein